VVLPHLHAVLGTPAELVGLVSLHWALSWWLRRSLHLEPLRGLLDLRLDTGEVHTTQRDHHLMAVQGGFQGNTDWCLWER